MKVSGVDMDVVGYDLDVLPDGSLVAVGEMINDEGTSAIMIGHYDSAGRPDRELSETGGFAPLPHSRNQVGYHFKDANDWWDVVWWAGYRGFVNQIPEQLADQFKQEHLDEINELADEEGIFFNVEVIHTIGEKA